jgi:hypothetical protein
VSYLADYAPAQELGFDEAELEQLFSLRGRASHAQSKKGIEELAAVEQECGRKLQRLKNLVERVLLTKKTWGSPTTTVEELTRLESYIGKDGKSVRLFRAFPAEP